MLALLNVGAAMHGHPEVSVKHFQALLLGVAHILVSPGQDVASHAEQVHVVFVVVQQMRDQLGDSLVEVRADQANVLAVECVPLVHEGRVEAVPQALLAVPLIHQPAHKLLVDGTLEAVLISEEVEIEILHPLPSGPFEVGVQVLAELRENVIYQFPEWLLGFGLERPLHPGADVRNVFGELPRDLGWVGRQPLCNGCH